MLLLVCSSANVFGQTQQRPMLVSGRTVDVSGAPVPGVRVDVDGNSSITDQNGEFTLMLDGPSGHFVLYFSSPGWRTPDIPITKARSGKDVDLGNVFLESFIEDFTVHGGDCCLDQIHYAVPQTLDFNRAPKVQTASVRDGNIYVTTSDGQVIWITTSGLDSDPHLSADKRLVVFVRKSLSPKIDTGSGPTEQNELWISGTSGQEKPRRVLVGHPGGLNIDANLVLAGFNSPQFSPDARQIRFLAKTWATEDSVRILDLSSGHVGFVRRISRPPVLSSR